MIDNGVTSQRMRACTASGFPDMAASRSTGRIFVIHLPSDILQIVYHICLTLPTGLLEM